MIDMLKFRKQRHLTALLGLTIEGSRLEGVWLRRNAGGLQIQPSLSVALSLDPLTADPELVGREIRNHLDAAGISERNCVVGLPLKWALIAHVEIPDLPEADLGGFLQIEAERSFPCDVTTLQLANSRSRLPSGKQQAMIVGIPRSHLARLEQAFRAAKLKPLGFFLGITALQPPGTASSEGVLALAIGETHVGLQVTSGGGVLALRALEGALEVEGSRKLLHADLVARETRITLGQLPAEVLKNVQRVRIFGPRDLAQQLEDEMELRLEPMGLKVELVTRYQANEFGLPLPADAAVSPALSLAAGQLAGRQPPFDLLPPRVRPWQQMAARYSSGRLRMAGAAAAAVFVIAGGAFAFQQWRLSSLQSEWNGMATRVRELEALQLQVRQYRPWYDDSLRGLAILRQLTLAFPEDGVVAARTVEIRDLGAVTCTGTTRDNQSLFKTIERLRANKEVYELRVPQIRGTKPPLQFTFDYRWSEGGGQ
jgi:hypothetical protein